MHSIGQFAEMTGFSADTLRYYEKLGLLSPERGSGARRQYSESHLAWVQFAGRLRSIGVPLEEIQVYSTLRSGR